MTVQDVIRLCLVVILVWLLMRVHWSLLIREWKRLQKRRRGELPSKMRIIDIGAKTLHGHSTMCGRRECGAQELDRNDRSGKI
jgi:hypothetical protein